MRKRSLSHIQVVKAQMSLCVCAVVSGLSLSVSIFCSIQWLIMLTKKMLIRHVVVSLVYLVVKCTCAACDFSVFLSLTVIVCVMSWASSLSVCFLGLWFGFVVSLAHLCLFGSGLFFVCCAHSCVVFGYFKLLGPCGGYILVQVLRCGSLVRPLIGLTNLHGFRFISWFCFLCLLCIV